MDLALTNTRLNIVSLDKLLMLVVNRLVIDYHAIDQTISFHIGLLHQHLNNETTTTLSIKHSWSIICNLNRLHPTGNLRCLREQLS